MGKSLQKYVPERMHFTPDLDTGHAQHVLVRLSGTPGTVTVVDIPSWATFIQLFSPTNIIFYAVDEDPAAGSVQTGADLTSSDLSVGDFLYPGFYVPRIPSASVSEIRFVSASASAEVYVSFSAGSLTVR
jgi:hypothetical protein